MSRLYIDVETYWNLGHGDQDLKDFGATRCLSDSSAGVNCIAWAIDDGPIAVIPHEQSHYGQWDQLFLNLIYLADRVVAHNVAFENAVLHHVLHIRNLKTIWHDTMAKCLYYGYPAGLDDAAKALQCTKLKDVQGKSVMKKLASGRYKPNDVPDLFNRLYSYCANDVAVMREIDQRLPDLPPQVQKLWQIDCEINQIGVPIDMTAINNAVWLKEEIAKRNDQQMAKLTNNYVQTVNQTEKIVSYINTNTARFIMPDCTADTVERLLGTTKLQPTERQVLELRQEAGLSSLAKYQKMANFNIDGRLHQMHFWYGAHTGRPTGSGPQVLNLPRSEDSEQWAELLVNSPKMFLHISKPAEKLKEALRACICAPPGKMLVGMDLAQAEARNAGWLAQDELSMRLFTTTDPYCTYGELMFGRKIIKKDDPDERNAAKASVLANGYAGGIGAGQMVAQNYGIDFDTLAKVILPTASPSELWEATRNYAQYVKKRPLKPLNEQQGMAVDISKQRFRKTFAKITAYWDELWNAFLYGGQAGPLTLEVKASGLRIMTLPSGRQLFYHGVEMGCYGKHIYQDRKDKTDIWKGTVMENACQAIAQDLSDWYKIRAHENIGNVVHHCYDEFTMEVDESRAEEMLLRLKMLTKTKPDWATNLPVGFDYWSGVRYGK